MITFDNLTAISSDSSVNAALDLTVASVAGQSHYLYGFGVSIAGTYLSSTIKIIIKDGSTPVYKTAMEAGSPIGATQFRSFPVPIKITSSMALAVDAGGTSVTTVGNLIFCTR